MLRIHRFLEVSCHVFLATTFYAYFVRLIATICKIIDTFLIFFFHLHLFDGVRSQYSHVLVVFLLFKSSDSFMFESMFSKAHQPHIALSEPMTSIDQSGSSSTSTSVTDLRVIDLILSPVSWEAVTKKRQFASRASRARRRGIRYLSLQYGVCVLTTKPLAKAEDVGSNQPRPRTQQSIPDQSQLPFSSKQLFSELIQGNLTRSLLVSSLHLLGGYLETTTQQPTPTADQH